MISWLPLGAPKKIRLFGAAPGFMGSGCFLQAMDFKLGLQNHSHMLMNIMKLQKLSH